jgi:sulfonate transport system ATP-binding protein
MTVPTPTQTATTPRQQTGVFAEQVVRTFADRTVLDHLDLVIDDEELVVLLGPSGCGKSTLLRLLAGLDRPDGGRIEVPAKRAIVFQGDRLLPWQRVLRNVTLGLRGPGADERARKALADVHLADRERAWLKQLSGGEAQRVALARALVAEPELILLDEPFAALDAITRVRMHDLVRELRRKHHASMLLVTHDVARIFNWAQQNPDEYAKAIVKETGVPLKDARATVDAYPFKVAQVLPADIKAEQDLSDAFLEAGEITKRVDVTTITDNLLPDGFDSSQSS